MLSKIINAFIEQKRLRRLFKNRIIPYDQINPKETLVKTNNKYWYFYSADLNATFKSDKTNDLIMQVWHGKRWKNING